MDWMKKVGRKQVGRKLGARTSHSYENVTYGELHSILNPFLCAVAIIRFEPTTVDKIFEAIESCLLISIHKYKKLRDDDIFVSCTRRVSF